MDRLVDLDVVAAELQARRARWVSRGLDVGAFTWRDAEASWPQPIVSDRALIVDPESLGVIMTASPSNLAELVLWCGGWADLDFVIDDQIHSEGPTYGDVAQCVAVAEYVADRLLSTTQPRDDR